MIKIKNYEAGWGVAVAATAVALVEGICKLDSMGILVAILALPGGAHECPDPGACIHKVAVYARHRPVGASEGKGARMLLLGELGGQETPSIVTVRAFPLKLVIVGIIMTVLAFPGSAHKSSLLD